MDHRTIIRDALQRCLTDGDSSNFAIVSAAPGAFVQIAAGKGQADAYVDVAASSDEWSEHRDALAELGFNPPDVGNPWQRLPTTSDEERDAIADALAQALVVVHGVDAEAELDVEVTLQ